MNIPHTTTYNGKELIVFNMMEYDSNDPRFIAGNNRYDAVGRWNARGVFTIKLLDIMQVFKDGDRYYIDYGDSRQYFNGCIPHPEIYPKVV